MTSQEFSKPSNKNAPWILFASSFGVMLFLGFIDEGYYNFNWMKDPGSIIALLIYMVIIFACQSLVYYVFFGKISFNGKLFTSAFLGIILGVFLSVLLFTASLKGF